MAPPLRSRSFPPFRLDFANQCLWRDNTRIPLAPKVFSVLEYLVTQAGRLVSQEELLDALWPETYVQPEVLRTYILEIRKALRDPAKKPRFIETLPKRGYRFIATVHEDNPVPWAAAPAADVGARLVGRASVLAELEAFRQAAAGGDRQIVFVTGEAGIGKTSLLDAFAQLVAADPAVRLARGHCVEGFGGKEAYYPVLEAFGLLIRRPDHAALIETLAAQAPTWVVQFPSILEPRETEKLRRELLGATPERMVRELCDALETLTADRLFVLILEDLQWVDNPTLDLISALARRRSPARLLLLATYRPVEVILSQSPLKLLKQDLLVHQLGREVSLSRLTETDVERYLAGHFPASDIPHRLGGWIHRHSDGNPLFMQAILDQLLRTGVIVREGPRWILTSGLAEPPLQIPETLQQMIETQLERLGGTGRQVLRAASVAGRRFSAWAAAALLDMGLEPVEETCDGLVASQQFLKRAPASESDNGAPLGDYEFKHVLYREILYRQLKSAQRRLLHLRLGEKMEMLPGADSALASELAFHFEEGQDYGKAVRYLVLTATNAMRRYAHGDAVQLLQHALGLIPRIPVDSGRKLEIDLLEKISDALYAHGEMSQSAEIDRRAAELAAQRGLKIAQVHALTREARALAFLDPGRCIAVCDRAAEVSRTVDDPLLQARAELLAACWHIVTDGWNQKDAEVCAVTRDRIHQLSQELAAYYEILYAHVQCIQGDYAAAYRTARAGIPKALENGSLVVYLSAHSSLTHALLHLGTWGQMTEIVASACDVAEKNQNAPWLGIFQAYLGWLYFQACDFQGAWRLSSSLLQRHQEQPAGQIRTMALVTGAFAAIECGTPEKAVPLLTSVCERPEHPRFFLDWYWRMMARLGLSRAWFSRNEWEPAGREADLFLQSALQGVDPNLHALAWEMKAHVAKDQPEVARDCLKKAFAALAAEPVPGAAWRVHAAASRQCALSGNQAEALRHRQQALAILRQLADSFPEGTPLRASLLSAARAHPLLGPL